METTEAEAVQIPRRAAVTIEQHILAVISRSQPPGLYSLADSDDAAEATILGRQEILKMVLYLHAHEASTDMLLGDRDRESSALCKKRAFEMSTRQKVWPATRDP